MVDFRLPEPKPANVDYVNAFARGYAAPDAMQAPGLVNALNRQKIAAEQRKVAGGEEYQRTGDVNALAVAKPMEVAALRELQHKREIEELPGLLKYGIAFGGGLANPETFEQTRNSMIGFHQRFDQMIPKTFTPGWYEQVLPRIVQALKLGEKTGNLNDVGLFLQNPEMFKQFQDIKGDASGKLTYDQRLGLQQNKEGLIRTRPYNILGGGVDGETELPTTPQTVTGPTRNAPRPLQPSSEKQSPGDKQYQKDISVGMKQADTSLPPSFRKLIKPDKSNIEEVKRLFAVDYADNLRQARGYGGATGKPPAKTGAQVPNAKQLPPGHVGQGPDGIWWENKNGVISRK